MKRWKNIKVMKHFNYIQRATILHIECIEVFLNVEENTRIPIYTFVFSSFLFLLWFGFILEHTWYIDVIVCVHKLLKSKEIHSKIFWET